MMKVLLFFCVVFGVLVSKGFGMELEEAKALAFSIDPTVAGEAVRDLQKRGEMGTLMKVVTVGRNQSTRLMATAALGEIGGKNVGEGLVAILESLNVAFVEGGTEQALENGEIKRAVVWALAKILSVPAPEGQDVTSISAFVIECKAGLIKLE